MIDKAHINYLLSEVLEDTDLFLVDLAVKPSNKIQIEIDSIKGINIDECAQVSAYIESKLNRDVEDYELEVSSPGLGSPLKVIQQYQKNIGKQVSVVLKNGIKLTGKLLEVSPTSFKVETQEKEKVDGKKKAEKLTIVNDLIYSEIKLTKVVISF